MYDELELDTLGDRKTALFLLMSDTDSTFNFLISCLLYTSNTRHMSLNAPPKRRTVPPCWRICKHSRRRFRPLRRGNPEIRTGASRYEETSEYQEVPAAQYPVCLYRPLCHQAGAVSYTHLDVYKRQALNPLGKLLRIRVVG